MCIEFILCQSCSAHNSGWEKYYNHPYFSGEETEAKATQLVWPTSPIPLIPIQLFVFLLTFILLQILVMQKICYIILIIHSRFYTSPNLLNWSFHFIPYWFHLYLWPAVIFFFKLYKIILVLPNIKMNPPQVYMCSPSWTLLPPPSPYHPSGSSQCTSPKHPVLCIEPGLATRFTHDIIQVSMPFSHIFPPSPSPTESIRLFYTSVSLLLSRTQGYCYHLSKFHIYALVYCIGLFLSGLLHSV